MEDPRKPIIFVPGPGLDNVVLNWVGLPTEKLAFYAEAFHLAGRALAGNYGCTGAMRDFEACPLVFLYRHSLELYLKAILMPGDTLLRLRGEVPMEMRRHLTRHALSDLFNDFERIVTALRWDWHLDVDGLRSRQQFGNLLKEFDRVDRGSFSFRYPMDKEGNPSLPHHFSFSVREFVSRMDPLLEHLQGAAMGVEAALEGEAESLAELREYQREQQAEYESWFRDEYGDEW